MLLGQDDEWGGFEWRRKGQTNLSRIRSLIISPKPGEILVLDPRHPVLILIVVSVLDPFGVGLLLLLVVGQAFVDGLFLVLGRVRTLFGGVCHGVCVRVGG